MGFTLPDGRLEQKLKDKRPLYSEGEAITEANRCIYCADAPCIQKCPTEIDIPTFIHKIATKNVKGAARTIFEANLLGTSCSRVCPVEVLCVGDCVYNHWGREPINIGRLQRFATESALKADPDLIAKTRKDKSGKRVALIGAGPASLAAAGHLALEGHSVVIYEKRDIPGGLNTLGIAPYKMHGDAALAEVEFIQNLGDVTLKTGVSVSADDDGDGKISAATLLKENDAVFIGVGLGPDTILDLEGIEGEGVVGATAFIERMKRDPSLSLDDKRRVVIIGGGNTAIDIAHEMALLGCNDVAMVYRRSESAMSAYKHEMKWGREDGVRVIANTTPSGVVRNKEGKVIALKASKAANGKAVPGSEHEIPCDFIALAVGQARLTKLAEAFEGVKLDEKGRVLVDDETCRTGNAKVYAGGDCVNGGAEVVNAAQHGKLAARAINAQLNA